MWLPVGLVAGVLGQIVLGGITVLVDLHRWPSRATCCCRRHRGDAVVLLRWPASRTVSGARRRVGPTRRSRGC